MKKQIRLAGLSLLAIMAMIMFLVGGKEAGAVKTETSKRPDPTNHRELMGFLGKVKKVIIWQGVSEERLKVERVLSFYEDGVLGDGAGFEMTMMGGIHIIPETMNYGDYTKNRLSIITGYEGRRISDQGSTDLLAYVERNLRGMISNIKEYVKKPDKMYEYIYEYEDEKAPWPKTMKFIKKSVSIFEINSAAKQTTYHFDELGQVASIIYYDLNGQKIKEVRFSEFKKWNEPRRAMIRQLRDVGFVFGDKKAMWNDPSLVIEIPIMIEYEHNKEGDFIKSRWYVVVEKFGEIRQETVFITKRDIEYFIDYGNLVYREEKQGGIHTYEEGFPIKAFLYVKEVKGRRLCVWVIPNSESEGMLLEIVQKLECSGLGEGDEIVRSKIIDEVIQKTDGDKMKIRSVLEERLGIKGLGSVVAFYVGS